MAKFIKAFLGKSYTKNGITKAYLYDPETDKYGWYNTGEYATEKGEQLFNDFESYQETTSYGIPKAQVLRENIQKVLETLANESHYVEGIYDLIDAIDERLENMSDYEIQTFSDYNAKAINLYFEYKDVNVEGLDARLIKIANSLGVDTYKYVESESVPESVQTTLNNIESVVNFSKDFEDTDIGITKSSYAHLTGRKLKEKK